MSRCLSKASVLAAGGVVSLAAGAMPSQASLGRAFAAPREVSQPTIEGKIREGQTVFAGEGIWANSPTSFTYQWQRCDENGAACVNISGATGKGFTFTTAEVAHTVVVLVTARNSDGLTTANSRPSSLVSANVAPANTVKPTVSGKAQVGEELTATPGTFSGGPALAYQWQRCDRNGASCTDVSGATGVAYGVRAADLDRTIRVSVIATNDLGSVSASSDTTKAVSPAAAPAKGSYTPEGATKLPDGGTSIPATSVSLPDRLVVSRIDFAPKVVSSRSKPVVVKVQIADVHGYAVAGAFVSVLGVPGSWVSSAAEQRTAADGSASFTFKPLADLPLRQGARLAFFVRARKEGDDLLVGVTAARLASVEIHP